MFFIDGWIAEEGEARAEGGDGEHEEAGGNDAEGREGNDGKIAETDFDDEEIDSPDGHEERDGESDGGAGGSAAVSGIYAHGCEMWAGGIRIIIRERGEKGLGSDIRYQRPDIRKRGGMYEQGKPEGTARNRLGKGEVDGSGSKTHGLRSFASLRMTQIVSSLSGREQNLRASGDDVAIPCEVR